MAYRKGVFKEWNTVKHSYDLQKKLYFQWMQHISVILSNYKNIIKQNNDINTFTTTEHHFIRKFKIPYGSKSNFKGAILDTNNTN